MSTTLPKLPRELIPVAAHGELYGYWMYLNKIWACVRIDTIVYRVLVDVVEFYKKTGKIVRVVNHLNGRRHDNSWDNLEDGSRNS